MTMLEKLRGGLIVSVQAWEGSAIDDARVLAAIAVAAERNGAVGVRMQGVENLQAARARLSIPIIGIIKRSYAGYEPYITPTLAEVEELLSCGVDIVAFDATERSRPGGTGVEDLVDAIHSGGALAMADCARIEDGVAAQAAGADILATTLCGYTAATAGTTLPALALARELADLERFTICEGGVHEPGEVRAALDAGADAVVVGTAITNIDWLVREFVALTPKGR